MTQHIPPCYPPPRWGHACLPPNSWSLPRLPNRGAPRGSRPGLPPPLLFTSHIDRFNLVGKTIMGMTSKMTSDIDRFNLVGKTLMGMTSKMKRLGVNTFATELSQNHVMFIHIE